MAETGPHKKLVRYKVKKDRAQQNIDDIKSVFRALEETRPDHLRYATFQLEDGVSFVHIAIVESADGDNPLQQFEEFKAFAGDIAERCEETPTISSIETIGAYRVFV